MANMLRKELKEKRLLWRPSVLESTGAKPKVLRASRPTVTHAQQKAVVELS